MGSGDELKKSQTQSALLVRNQLTKIQDVSKKQDISFERVQRLVNQACDLKFDNIRKEEMISSLNKQEKRIKAEKKAEKKDKGEDNMTDEHIMWQYRKDEATRKLFCKLCGKREKDAMLVKCFCVFCESCLKGIYSKKKKNSVCPNGKCKHPFGKSDIKKIYLT